MPETPEQTYTGRLTRAAALRDLAHRRWSLLGNIRLVFAILAIVGVWQEWQNPATIWKTIMLTGVLGFVVVALQQRRARLVRDRLDIAIAINQRSLHRLHHAWDHLPMPPESGADRTHPYAWDLNIVGEASVAQRIGTPVTSHGWRTLYGTLLDDRTSSDLQARQLAVMELAGKLDVRQRVEAAAADDIPDALPLETWSVGPNLLDSRAWLKWAAVLGPAGVILCAALTALSIVPWVVMLIPITFNTLVFMLAGGDAAADVRKVTGMRDAVASYREIMAGISNDTPVAPLLAELDGRLSGASLAMGSLARTANFVMPAGSMLYFPLQMLFMWDINVLNRLEGWRSRHGRHVTRWLEAMGEWEALAALSVLTHDHLEWTVPLVDPATVGFSATGLAHPLLVPGVAVENDVAISPRGAFLFVTGSNMSGKSTLLRAIGVNVVLAQAGAMVAATSLTMPPLQVSCCMRVEDSLAQGVSFFMAELRRLKAVIDRVQAPDGRVPLYLLDEILQGTNTAERQIASRRVLEQLTSLPALGAVSSHDLELITGTALEQVAIPVHFAEQFHRDENGPQMTFDYHLRPGLATSSNAIRLMEMIGFDIHE